MEITDLFQIYYLCERVVIIMQYVYRSLNSTETTVLKLRIDVPSAPYEGFAVILLM